MCFPCSFNSMSGPSQHLDCLRQRLALHKNVIRIERRNHEQADASFGKWSRNGREHPNGR